MEMNWVNGLWSGALVALLIWWIWHRARRTLEDRCPQCGCLGQRIVYYMEIGDASPRGMLEGHYFMTYKFLQCRRNPSHVRCQSRDRHISHCSVWLKKKFKPWQFQMNQEIIRLMAETGVSCPTKILELRHHAKALKLSIVRHVDTHLGPRSFPKE